MNKYIIKESALRSDIKKIIAEELSGAINESLGHALGSALKNTLKIAAKGTIAPGLLASDAIEKTGNIVNGPDTVTKTISDFFGGNSSGSGASGSGKKSRADKQKERLSYSRGLNSEYGRPETVPGFGRKFKLDKKTEIMVPEEILDDKGKCVQWGSRTGDWGSFGKHYHDEGDRMWQRIFKDKENALLRNCRNDQSKLERLKKKYKRVLVDWLKERDREYEIYIKST